MKGRTENSVKNRFNSLKKLYIKLNNDKSASVESQLIKEMMIEKEERIEKNKNYIKKIDSPNQE